MVEPYDQLYEKLLDSYVRKHGSPAYVRDLRETSAALRALPPLPAAAAAPPYVRYPSTPGATATERHRQAFVGAIFAKTEFRRAFEAKAVGAEGAAPPSYAEVARMACDRTSFSLTPTQRLLKAFFSPLTPYNSLILYHDVGVGKTCTAISIAEQHHSRDPKHKVIVVCAEALKDNFKRQIFDSARFSAAKTAGDTCAGNKYPDIARARRRPAPDPPLLAEVEADVEQLIRAKYEFVSYDAMRAKIDAIADFDESRGVSDERFSVLQQFSNRLIIIDEAHNLRSSVGGSGGEGKANKKRAEALRSLLTHTANAKLLLLTATPMYDNAEEIVWLFNLVLANDGRPPIKREDVFDAAGAVTASGRQVLQNLSSSYVSFKQGKNPFTFPFRLWPRKVLALDRPGLTEDQQLRLFLTPTSPHQDRAIAAASARSSSGKFNFQIAQLLNATYPDGEDFDSVFEVRNIAEGQKTLAYRAPPGVRVFDEKHLPTYAPKIDAIMRAVDSSAGIVLVYAEIYKTGILPVCLALEHRGFQRYDRANILVGEGGDAKNRKQASSQKYALLSGSDAEWSRKADQKRVIEACTAHSNRHGEDIKVIVVSVVGSEGIDLKNVREVHVLEPWHNIARINQVVGRAIRNCSHTALPVHERNVTVYLHASRINARDQKAHHGSDDVVRYERALEKYAVVEEVQALLRRGAFDCNFQRLAPSRALADATIVQVSAQNEKAEIDLNELLGSGGAAGACAASYPAGPEDKSTMSAWFLTDEVEQMVARVKTVFRDAAEGATLDFDGVAAAVADGLGLRELGESDAEVLVLALQELSKLGMEVVPGGLLERRAGRYMVRDTKSPDARIRLDEGLTRKNRIRVVSAFRNDPVDLRTAETLATILQAIRLRMADMRAGALSVLAGMYGGAWRSAEAVITDAALLQEQADGLSHAEFRVVAAAIAAGEAARLPENDRTLLAQLRDEYLREKVANGEGQVYDYYRDVMTGADGVEVLTDLPDYAAARAGTRWLGVFYTKGESAKSKILFIRQAKREEDPSAGQACITRLRKDSLFKDGLQYIAYLLREEQDVPPLREPGQAALAALARNMSPVCATIHLLMRRQGAMARPWYRLQSLKNFGNQPV